jgi:hypothetical protein
MALWQSILRSRIAIQLHKEITMLSKQTILGFAVAIALPAVSAYAADDPTQPNHFWSTFTGQIVAQSGEQYLDAHNPLSPRHFAKGQWEETAASAFYIDNKNPRHPSYQK